MKINVTVTSPSFVWINNVCASAELEELEKYAGVEEQCSGSIFYIMSSAYDYIENCNKCVVCHKNCSACIAYKRSCQFYKSNFDKSDFVYIKEL